VDAGGFARQGLASFGAEGRAKAKRGAGSFFDQPLPSALWSETRSSGSARFAFAHPRRAFFLCTACCRGASATFTRPQSPAVERLISFDRLTDRFDLGQGRGGIDCFSAHHVEKRTP
jgi:hypothetical protein